MSKSLMKITPCWYYINGYECLHPNCKFNHEFDKCVKCLSTIEYEYCIYGIQCKKKCNKIHNFGFIKKIILNTEKQNINIEFDKIQYKDIKSKYDQNNVKYNELNNIKKEIELKYKNLNEYNNILLFENNKLKNEIFDNNEFNLSLINEINYLKKNNDNISFNLYELNRLNISLINEINNLKKNPLQNENLRLLNFNNELKNKINNLEILNNNNKIEFENLKNNNYILNNQICDLINKNKELQIKIDTLNLLETCKDFL
jgi:exonuclease SbcC